MEVPDERSRYRRRYFMQLAEIVYSTVQAEVCLKCGERLYSQKTVRHFEQIRAKLEKQEVGDFEPMGQSFKVA